MTDPILSVVTVSYAAPDDLIRLGESLRAHTHVPYEWIIVDNGAGSASHAIYNGAIQSCEACDESRGALVIHNNTNMGYAYAVNQGLAIARGTDHLVFTNPDVVVYDGWYEQLLCAARQDGVGAVGPVSDYVTGDQHYRNHSPGDLNPVSFEERASLLEMHNAWKTVDTKLLIGFFTLIPRDVYEKYGGLDASFFFGHDDLDLSWRLRSAGLRLLIATDCYVHHAGEKSSGTLDRSTFRQLVRNSGRALMTKLEAHYGVGNVPSDEDLWGIDWFRPGIA